MGIILAQAIQWFGNLIVFLVILNVILSYFMDP